MNRFCLYRILCILSYGIFYAEQSEIISGRGFILTAPKVLDAGSTEFITLSLFKVQDSGFVTVQLLKAYSDNIIAETKILAQNNYNAWGQLEIPDIKDTTARLHIHDNFEPSSGYHINATKEIRIRHKSVITFIQTDKPIYKPGQTVKFRLLPLDSQLVPLDNKTTGDIWIEDPTGIRIAQWKKLSLYGGIIQLELPLSEEPVLGSWTIHSRIRDITNSVTFRVDEYVLPKFDVIIHPPPYIMADVEEIEIQICAQYTYGKKVEGFLEAKVTYQLYPYEKDNRALPFMVHRGPISGCEKFIVHARDIELFNRLYAHRTIEIFAEVTENSTEIRQNSSVTRDISHTLLEIEFLGAEKDSHYFKPGLPYYGELQVTKPDGSVASSESIKVCAKPKRLAWESNTELCNTFLSDQDGRVQFTVPPQTPSVQYIFVEAKSLYEEKMYFPYGVKVHAPYSNIYLKAWHSPSNSHLQIEPITREVKCDKLESVKIHYTTYNASTIKFYHQVISRGRIVQQGSHHRTFSVSKEMSSVSEDPRMLHSQPQQGPRPFGIVPLKNVEEDNDDHHESKTSLMVGEFMLSFDARATMSPIARLLVFYVRDDGEVVADSRTFRISQCLKNQVKLHFRHPQQYPNTEAPIFLSANPHSVCGIGLIDKSVHLLHPEEQFSRQKVFDLMKTFDVDKQSLPKQISDNYCQRKNNYDTPTNFGFEPLPPVEDPLKRRKRYVLMDLRTRTEFVDTITAFEDAGMVVITDFVLESRPCTTAFIEQPNRIYEMDPILLSAELPGRSRFNDRIPVSFSSKPDFEVSNKLPEPLSQKSPQKSSLEIRSYFPETWLWELHNVSSSGEIALKRELPHTITQWIGKAICVHPVTGLGISEDSSITAFQPFFASFSLPYSVIRGEVVSLVVSVFNYLSECLPIKLSLETSESFKNMGESASQKLCVCGEKSESRQFRIRPLVLGHINVTVYAYSLQEDAVCENEIITRLHARDAVTRQLLVEAEGFPKEETTNLYFCPEKANGSFSQEVDLLLPDNAVDGSGRGFMSVTGDLMGPALSGLESLVRLPVGCGEQNMVLFTPNIYVLDYLTSTNRLTDEIKHRTMDYLKTGYQRELRYRHEDGSYSAFGKSDNQGSMWLTAFVVKSFAQARRFILIDEEDLAVSTSWIVQKQLENGCFLPVGELLNKALKGGLKKNDESLAPLTAFVLISLLESNYRDNDTVKSAVFCLKSEKYPSTYSLALFAYATALANSPDSQGYLDSLETRAIKSDHFVYWDYGDRDSRAINVEIAGYAILTMLELGGADSLARALPVVRWITQQRNSNGGFVSTQDTVVALQALAKYASFNSDEQMDVSVNIESEELVHSFKVSETNKILMQTVKLPSIPTVVDLQAVGQGCVLAQFSMKYNLDTAPEDKAFDLNVVATRTGKPDCDIPVIKICMRYNVPNQETNMVIVEAKMVSGYAPDEFELHMLHNNRDLKLRRHDVKDNKVVFYFSKLTEVPRCFEFYVKNEINVEDTSAAIVKIYDYYQPELQAMTSYQIPVTCSSDYYIDKEFNLPPLPSLNTSTTNQEEHSEELITDSEVLLTTDNPVEIENHTSVSEITSIVNTLVNNNDGNKESTQYSTHEDDDNTAEAVMMVSHTDTSTDSGVEQNLIEDMELADSPQRSRSHENFVNIDEDLNFPDGIEGNQPVSVAPPSNFNSPFSNQEPDCPICYQGFPKNFSDIYCSAAFVLRISIRDAVSGKVKILNDVSAELTRTKAIKEFGSFSFSDSCDCPLLRQNGNVFVIGSKADLWQVSSEKHQLILNSNTQVVPAAHKTVLPHELKLARRHCSP